MHMEAMYSGVKGGCEKCRLLWAVKYIYLKQDKGKFGLKGNQLTFVLLSPFVSFTAGFVKNVLDCSGSLGQYDFCSQVTVHKYLQLP